MPTTILSEHTPGGKSHDQKKHGRRNGESDLSDEQEKSITRGVTKLKDRVRSQKFTRKNLEFAAGDVWFNISSKEQGFWKNRQEFTKELVIAFFEKFPEQELTESLTTILSPLTERESSRRQSYRVDRTKGIIYGVKLGQSRSRNQGTPDSDVDLPRVYTSKLMEKFVGTSGNPGLYHDIPVQQGHKPVPAEERMGRVYNPRFETVSGQRVIIGDWHLNTDHRLYKWIVQEADKFPGNIALSHEIVDWEESTTDESILIEDAKEVLWFSLVSDGGLNKSLDESKDTTPKPPTNPFLNVALSLFEDRIMPKKLTDQSTLAELAELNPNLAKRLLEECGCSDPPKTTDDGSNAAMMLRLKQLEEENDDLKQKEARSQLKTNLAGYYKQLTEGLDKSLITELSDQQLDAFSMMEEATAKAAIEAIVNTIKTTAKTVAESFKDKKSSLIESIDYPEGDKKTTSTVDLSRFSGAYELNGEANRLSGFLN